MTTDEENSELLRALLEINPRRSPYDELEGRLIEECRRLALSAAIKSYRRHPDQRYRERLLHFGRLVHRLSYALNLAAQLQLEGAQPWEVEPGPSEEEAEDTGEGVGVAV